MKIMIKKFAIKWNRPVDNNFAVACYDQNTVAELKESLEQEADKIDMSEWGITEEEWRDAISAALKEKQGKSA